MDINIISIDEIINSVFIDEPKSPCSYDLLILKHQKKHRLLPILMNVLIMGAKKLYGDDITQDNITIEQFNRLNKYFLSIGYYIRYNYTYNEDTYADTDTDIPTKVNIWFERYNPQIDCHGRFVILKN